MALVRISNELRADVRNSVSNIYDPKIRAANGSHEDWGKAVYDLLMAPYKDNLDNVKPEFVNTTDRITLRGIKDVAHFSAITFSIPTSPWPARNFYQIFPFVADYSYSGILLKDDPALGGLRQEMIDYADRVAVAEQERRTVQTTIDALLDAHNTLASALDAWPALWELLPESTKQRHAAPTDRNKQMLSPQPDLTALDNLAADFARKRLLAQSEKK